MVVAIHMTAAARGPDCLASQYADPNDDHKCVDYASPGTKAAGMLDVPIDSGNTAWMLCASALVMIMTPGVAFFYAGLSGEDMASNTMMMSFMSMALVSLQFWAFGYSASFSSDGVFAWAGYNHVGEAPSATYASSGVPHILFAFFQIQFAAITPALLSGGIVGRMKFSTYLVFIVLWSSIVYDPLANWMWSFQVDASTWTSTAQGWEGKMGALDFAGGTVIHVASGFGALAAALLVGARHNANDAVKPHNVPLVMIGTTLLWFGWFGFNAGSQGAADGIAAIAAINTHLAPCAGFLTWATLEYAFHKQFSPCGAASGAVAGLVSVTPGCGYILPWAAVIFGVVGAAAGFMAVHLKNKLRYDDTLDAFGIHGIAGFTGGLLTGLFANPAVNPNIVGGAFYGHDMQFVYQLVAQAVAAGYSFAATCAILFALKLTMGLRISDAKAQRGMDCAYHGGMAYDRTPKPPRPEGEPIPSDASFQSIDTPVATARSALDQPNV